MGTQIVKTFAMPHDMTDAKKGEELLETRIIEHKPSGWYGYSYVWNKEQTEATLALGEHGRRELEALGRFAANEQLHRAARQPVQELPRGNGADLPPAGSQGRNLNKEFAYHDARENQLAHWTRVARPPPAPAKRGGRPALTIPPRARSISGPAPGSTSIALTATTRTVRPARRGST